jgi:ATP-binding cassette subfamily B protein
VGQRVMMDMRLQLFAHLQKMAIPFFDRNPVGRLVTRLTNDISTLEQVITQGVVQTLTNLVMLIGIVIVLFLLEWRLAAMMLILLPILIFFVRRFAIAQRESFREQRAWLSRINAYLNENITGMTVVQLSTARSATWSTSTAVTKVCWTRTSASPFTTPSPSRQSSSSMPSRPA